VGRFFIQMLLFSIILLPGFQAWGEPAPASLFIAEADSLQFTLSGNLFGAAPENLHPGKLVSSADGLRGCVLLADSPVLENCGHLEILSVNQWEGTTITFVPGANVPEESKTLFIFVMDGEGNHSLPVGPLNVVDGQLSIDSQATDLMVAPYRLGEGESVQVLQPDPGPPGPPGQPFNSSR